MHFHNYFELCTLVKCIISRFWLIVAPDGSSKGDGIKGEETWAT
jgi:hypothetical protein